MRSTASSDSPRVGIAYSLRIHSMRHKAGLHSSERTDSPCCKHLASFFVLKVQQVRYYQPYEPTNVPHCTHHGHKVRSFSSSPSFFGHLMQPFFLKPEHVALTIFLMSNFQLTMVSLRRYSLLLSLILAPVVYLTSQHLQQRRVSPQK